MTHQKLTKVLLGALLALTLASCGTPRNIAYMQDTRNESEYVTVQPAPIRLKPMDQISVVVNSLDPQVTAMFNLPYITRRLGETQSLTSPGLSSQAQGISGYTVDSRGYIDFPVVGEIRVQGMTRAEAAAHIKQILIDSRQIKDPVVIVEFMNLSVSVIGEVQRPGRYRIDRDEFTIIDALSLAGDLTINGKREKVTVVRNAGKAEEHVYTLDLTRAGDIFNSPAYYLQQGDVVYVVPNEKRMRESTVNGNNVRSTSFWFSLTSGLISLASFVMLLLKQ